MFKTILCKEVGQKNNKKLPENVRKTWKFSVFPKYSVFQGAPKQQVCPRFKHCSPRSLSIFWQKVEKKEFDNFSKFCLFRSRFRTISYWKTVFISFLSILDNTYFPCWPFSIFPIGQVCQKFGKNAWNLWKLEIFGIFVIFGVNLRHFQTEYCNYVFIKDYGTYQLFHCWPFKTFQSTKSVKL